MLIIVNFIYKIIFAYINLLREKLLSIIIILNVEMDTSIKAFMDASLQIEIIIKVVIEKVIETTTLMLTLQ